MWSRGWMHGECSLFPLQGAACMSCSFVQLVSCRAACCPPPPGTSALSIVVHPQYNHATNEYDVAVINLVSAVPADVAVVAINTNVSVEVAGMVRVEKTPAKHSSLLRSATASAPVHSLRCVFSYIVMLACGGEGSRRVGERAGGKLPLRHTLTLTRSPHTGTHPRPLAFIMCGLVCVGTLAISLSVCRCASRTHTGGLVDAW